MSKKIVFASYAGYPNESTGGPNKVIHQLINSIDKNTFSVCFVSGDYPSGTTYNNNGSPVGLKKKISSGLTRKFSFARKFFSNPYYLKYHFNKKENNWKNCSIGGDILHAHDVRALFHLRNNFKRKILTIHSKGGFKNDFMDYFGASEVIENQLEKFIQMENEALRLADKIVFPSYAAKEQYFNDTQNKMVEKKSVVIHNGIDVEKIQAIKPQNNLSFINRNDCKILLTVSDHIKTKRIDLLIETVYLLKEKGFNAVLIVVGKGPLTNELKQLAQRLNIKKQILFFPPQRNEEIISLMKICDLYLMASERVIYDMVILEAIAAGCTVIANNIGGNKEIINNGINGYLLEMENADVLAEFINKFDFIKKLNLKESLDNISFDVMTKKYETVYEELLV